MYKAVLKHDSGITVSGNTTGNKLHYKSNGRFASAALSSASQQTFNAANNLQSLSNDSRLYKKKPRADLSKLSDKELQQIVNRERLEQDYDRLFNPPRETTAKKFLDGTVTALKIASLAAGLVASGITIYNGLKNKPVDLSGVSDDELRAFNNRRKLEENYYKYMS